MNFKEIHSNTEFLSTYRRARACSCRNKIKNAFIEKRQGLNVLVFFGTFRLLLGGVNCAKRKRHVAPNSRVNLGETVQCTVS